MKERFRIKHLRGAGVVNWWAVEALGNPQLVETGESPPSTLITAFGGEHAKVDAINLVRSLNKAFEERGKEVS